MPLVAKEDYSSEETFGESRVLEGAVMTERGVVDLGRRRWLLDEIAWLQERAELLGWQSIDGGGAVIS